MQQYPDRGLHGRLVNQLGSQIVNGRVPAGVVLDTEELASRSDVSRTVVRESLKVLTGKGLVDARPRRGTYVLERDHWNLLDPDVLRWQFETVGDAAVLDKLHEVRVMIEPAAAALAAQRRTDDDVAELAAALSEMDDADEHADAIAQADLRFHLGLIAATHNELVQQLSMVIGIGLSARDRFVHTHRISIKRSLGMHHDVAEAVRRGDPDAARAAMVALLESAAKDVAEAHDLPRD